MTCLPEASCKTQHLSAPGKPPFCTQSNQAPQMAITSCHSSAGSPKGAAQRLTPTRSSPSAQRRHQCLKCQCPPTWPSKPDWTPRPNLGAKPKLRLESLKRSARSARRSSIGVFVPMKKQSHVSSSDRFPLKPTGEDLKNIFLTKCKKLPGDKIARTEIMQAKLPTWKVKLLKMMQPLCCTRLKLQMPRFFFLMWVIRVT